MAIILPASSVASIILPNSFEVPETGDSAINYLRDLKSHNRVCTFNSHFILAACLGACAGILLPVFLSSQLHAGQTPTSKNTNEPATQNEQTVAQNKLPDNKAPAKQQESDKLDKHAASAELVSNVSYDGKTLAFTAISNGCTSPGHFKISHQTDADMCQLTIIRTQPDYCRRVPQAVEITVAWSRPAGTEGMPLVITNPLLETALAKQRDK